MKTINFKIFSAIILVGIMLFLNSCEFKAVKRMSDRQDIVREILGPSYKDGVTNWRYEIQKDTINEVTLDSTAVKLAMELGVKQDAYRKLNSKLESLFPEGDTYTTVGKLTAEQFDVYKKMVSLLEEIAPLRIRLKERIASFKPAINPVVIVNPGNRTDKHYFFFNEDNELVTHFLDENIYLTKDIFKEFVEKNDLNKFYLSSLNEAVNNIDSLSSTDFLLEKATPLKIYRFVYHAETSTPSYQKQQNETYAFPAGANLYVVKKQTYVTSTRKAYDRLVEYANDNDLSSIDYMVVNGEIGILNAGEEVMMLDCGFSVSKVKNKKGDIIFVDTGSIRKKD